MVLLDLSCKNRQWFVLNVGLMIIFEGGVRLNCPANVIDVCCSLLSKVTHVYCTFWLFINFIILYAAQMAKLILENYTRMTQGSPLIDIVDLRHVPYWPQTFWVHLTDQRYSRYIWHWLDGMKDKRHCKFVRKKCIIAESERAGGMND